MLFPALSSHSAWLFPSWLILIVYIQRFSILLTYQISLFRHTESCPISLGKCSVTRWEAAVHRKGMSNPGARVQLRSAPDKPCILWSQQEFPNNPKSTESGQCWEALPNAISQRTRNYSFCYDFEFFLFIFFFLHVFACFLKHENFRLLLVPSSPAWFTF